MHDTFEMILNNFDSGLNLGGDLIFVHDSELFIDFSVLKLYFFSRMIESGIRERQDEIQQNQRLSAEQHQGKYAYW